MKLTARLTLLLILAGILVLSAPSLAGERAGAKPQVAQLQSSPETTAPTFMQSVMAAVKTQLRLWLKIDRPPTVKPEIKPTTSDGPVKSFTDPNKRKPWLELLQDNGGDHAT